MGIGVFLKHFIVSNLLTLYYSVFVLVILVLNKLKNPFADPWAQTLKLEPPSCLTDPKYGVHKYIKANDVKLHYLESGDPSKPLMVFVHGFPEFWYSWRYQILEFQKKYWCIAFDMRGYGDSERPESMSSYALNLLVDDIRDLVRQLGREKCILISHDWGGLIACRFRDMYPDALEAIVVLGSTSREAWFNVTWSNPDQLKMSWYVFMYRMPGLAEKLLYMNDLDVFNKAMLVPGKDTVTLQDIECYKYWFRKAFALTSAINYYRQNFAYTLPEKKKCELKIPMLVVMGENDAYVHRSNIAALEKEYAFMESAIIKDCGHFLQQEEPEKTNKTITDFLTKYNL